MKNKTFTIILVMVLIFGSLPINVMGENLQSKIPIIKRGTSNLVAHYKFDGDLKDSSSYGNDGKVAKGSVTYVTGKFGKGAKFDGKSYIEVVDSDSLDLTTRFTISVWLYKDEIYNDLPILAKGLEGNPDMGIGIPYALYHSYAGTQPTLQIHSPDDWMDILVYDKPTEFNTLHMLTISVDIPNKQMKYYLNGQLVKGEASDWYFSSDKLHKTDESLFIGCSKLGDTLDLFKGYMDDLRIYNKVLSQEEVKSLYIGETQESNEYVSMSITPNKLVIMKVKDILNINVTGTKSDGKKEDIKSIVDYKSSNVGVFTVDKEGKVVGIGKGTATLTITSGSLIRQISITVK